ncbi:hypothetical protein HPP05_42225, partial [Corallococcus exiguus]|nr:hypothetical protein [Corallococcus exiguus]
MAGTTGDEDDGRGQDRAKQVARVTEFALTDGDAYDVWPSAPCDPAVSACYHSKPAGTTDFS